MQETKKQKHFIKKTTCLAAAVACVAVVLSLFLVQAFSAPQPEVSEELDATDSSFSGNEELSAIPLLFLLLPFAAIAAYVLEKTNPKNKQPTNEV
ncbi:MAG: hypothetical protein NWF00_10395 [Candidatus Bathyarchaeota archaeon]|nr:hypothetical protein [Candidatus Bathyarchaeota archaeon]